MVEANGKLYVLNAFTDAHKVIACQHKIVGMSDRRFSVVYDSFADAFAEEVAFNATNFGRTVIHDHRGGTMRDVRCSNPHCQYHMRRMTRF